MINQSSVCAAHVIAPTDVPRPEMRHAKIYLARSLVLDSDGTAVHSTDARHYHRDDEGGRGGERRESGGADGRDVCRNLLGVLWHTQHCRPP